MPGQGFSTLAAWLAWQETLHPSEIELGLERVREVARRLLPPARRHLVITVAGTNGKGSVCAYLQAILEAGGYRTGLYTSPHLLQYNERVQIDGLPVADQQLVSAFERIDAARGDISLTYFEFGTLAALLLFEEAAVEVAILEVGLGGRLDAVNVVAADLAIITSIDLDHQEWLGDTREQIAREKAGIMRPGRIALCGDREPPESLLQHASETGAKLSCLGRDFDWQEEGVGWSLSIPGHTLAGLPRPALASEVQLDNAALAVAALSLLGERIPIALGHVHQGLERARLPGRIQVLDGKPGWVFDVGHNPAAARVLAHWLEENPVAGKTLAVLGMLADKDVAGFVAPLAPLVDRWLLASLPGRRGLAAVALGERIGPVVPVTKAVGFDSVAEAISDARRQADAADRILVCGSFHTVGAAMALEL